MKLSAVALDFDGTIARSDTMDPGVREAIGELRAQGIVVAIVTGRILEDLQRVVGDLHFVDAVVAENGAVITFPASGHEMVMGARPPDALLTALRGEGIAIDSGRVVVEAEAGDAPRILEIVRRLELPLMLAFNRNRVMILPEAISKGTGLIRALTVLRLSAHNTVAVGDAENDHQLLQACEHGVAVEWGSPALKMAADYVLPGDGPPAVAAYLRTLAASGTVPAPVNTRRRLLLGYTDAGAELALAVRGRNVLVAGDPKSGKSWVAGLLAEQLILHGYCLCLIDPEGDYASLEALPGVVVFGGADPLPRSRDLLRALRHPDVSVVLDLSHATHEEKLDYLRSVLPGLSMLRHHTGLPHRVVVDEAHYFLHGADVSRLLDPELRGYTLVTYRASKLHREVLAASEAILVTRESDPNEVRALYRLCQPCAQELTVEDWQRLLGSLTVGEAVALPVTQEAGGEVRRIRLAPRLTPHVRHLAKYIDIPVPHGRAFVFWRNGAPTDARAHTLRELVSVLEHVSLAALDGHLRRRDFSRWVAEVFGDYPLAKELQRLEEQYQQGSAGEIAGSLSRAIRTRYEFVEPIPQV